MTASKISNPAQGTMEDIMRLAFVICLPVSTPKQLFAFCNIVFCHLVLSVSRLLPPFSFSLSLFLTVLATLFLSSGTFSSNRKHLLSLPRFFHCLLSFSPFFVSVP